MRSLKIKPGIIEINESEILLDGPHCVFIELDCVQKYPDVCAYSGNSIFLGKGNNTLHVKDEDAEPTEVIIVGLEDGFDWSIIAEAGRYNVQIVAVRPGKE
jgi:hypothetical protein